MTRTSCDYMCRWRIAWKRKHPNDPLQFMTIKPSAVAFLPTPFKPGTSTAPVVQTAARAPRVVNAQDVAHFLAAAGEVHAEPDGWAVVGVPANYWIQVEPRTVYGQLLGEGAQVRFTPVTYLWDYGDGAGHATTTGGSSWAALGQDELTETPTSHVFRSTGRTTVRVTVAFEAEYRLGGGAWTPVAGEVTAAAPPVPVRVVVERTLLTATD